MTKTSLMGLGAGAVLAALVFSASPAHAGIPECGNVRLEGASGCELRGNLNCTAGCDNLGVYKKACATKLHTVCKDTCVLDPEPACTDSCTETCTSRCDAGVNINCTHNCFGECDGACATDCAGAADVDQCMASCEATCDGECDVKCAPLVNASCYEHCIECCDGSCTAQVNMTCQTSCQDEEFETCEYEIKADCSASCDGGGALFCDGEYVISGAELPACIEALIARGELNLDLEGELKVDLNGDAEGNGCSVGAPPASGTAVGLFGLAFGWAFARRRKSGRARS